METRLSIGLSAFCNPNGDVAAQVNVAVLLIESPYMALIRCIGTDGWEEGLTVEMYHPKITFKVVSSRVFSELAIL